TVRTFPHWVAWSHDCSIGTARREVRLAHTLRDHLPATAAHARAGTVGSDHVRALAEIGTTSAARCRALAEPIGDGDASGGQDPDASDAQDGATQDGATQDDATQDDADRPPTGEEHLLALARAYPAGVFRRFVRHF